MLRIINLSVAIGVIFFFAACATSMSPTEVNRTLPTLTKSKLISKAQAVEAIKTNDCEYLVKGRSYTVPVGLSVKGELRSGAKGIDEWVELDGGNAYVLVNYNWVAFDDLGSTQLNIKFDTMNCD